MKTRVSKGLVWFFCVVSAAISASCTALKLSGSENRLGQPIFGRAPHGLEGKRCIMYTMYSDSCVSMSMF